MATINTIALSTARVNVAVTKNPFISAVAALKKNGKGIEIVLDKNDTMKRTKMRIAIAARAANVKVKSFVTEDGSLVVQRVA